MSVFLNKWGGLCRGEHCGLSPRWQCRSALSPLPKGAPSKFRAISSRRQKIVSAKRLSGNSIASATSRLSAGVVPKASGCRVLLKVPLPHPVFRAKRRQRCSGTPSRRPAPILWRDSGGTRPGDVRWTFFAAAARNHRGASHRCRHFDVADLTERRKKASTKLLRWSGKEMFIVPMQMGIAALAKVGKTGRLQPRVRRRNAESTAWSSNAGSC